MFRDFKITSQNRYYVGREIEFSPNILMSKDEIFSSIFDETPNFLPPDFFLLFFFHLFRPLIFPPRYRLVFNPPRHPHFDILPQNAMYTHVNTFSKTASKHSILSPRKRQVNTPPFDRCLSDFLQLKQRK